MLGKNSLEGVDTFIRIKRGNERLVKTDIVRNNLNPTYNEKFLILFKKNEEIKIKIYSPNYILKDNFLGCAFLQINEVLFAEKSKTLMLDILDENKQPNQ